jgi:hypothetical protein
MDFDSPQSVRCVSVKNADYNFPSQFWIQAKNMATGEYEEVWNGIDLIETKNAWNEVPNDRWKITYHPWNKCEDKYACQNGVFVEDFGIQSCMNGYLFDVELGKCMSENTVDYCPLDCISSTPSPSKE